MSAIAGDLSEIAPWSTEGPILLHAGRVRENAGWHRPAKAHEFHELVIVTRGSLLVEAGDGRVRAGTGDMLFYHAGLVHEEFADGPEGVEMLFLGFAWDPVPPDLPLVVPDAAGRARLLLEWLLEERSAAAPEETSPSGSFFRSVLAVFLDACRPGEDRLVSEVRRYVGAHMDETLSLDDLARAVNLSKYYFLRRYKRLTGRTPMDDVRRMRVEYARRLILTTDLPLKAVAPIVGLGDEYAFSKLFRKILGVTPGSLRRRR